MEKDEDSPGCQGPNLPHSAHTIVGDFYLTPTQSVSRLRFQVSSVLKGHQKKSRFHSLDQAFPNCFSRVTSFYHLCRTCSFTWTLGPCRFPCAIEIPFAHPSWPFTLSFTIGTLHGFFSLTPRLSQSHRPACSHLFSFTSISCLAGHSPVCSNPPEPPPPTPPLHSTETDLAPNYQIQWTRFSPYLFPILLPSSSCKCQFRLPSLPKTQLG